MVPESESPSHGRKEAFKAIDREEDRLEQLVLDTFSKPYMESGVKSFDEEPEKGTGAFGKTQDNWGDLVDNGDASGYSDENTTSFPKDALEPAWAIKENTEVKRKAWGKKEDKPESPQSEDTGFFGRESDATLVEAAFEVAAPMISPEKPPIIKPVVLEFIEEQG